MEGEGGRCLKRGIRQILRGGGTERVGGGEVGGKGFGFKEEENICRKLCPSGSLPNSAFSENFPSHFLSLCQGDVESLGAK